MEKILYLVERWVFNLLDNSDYDDCGTVENLERSGKRTRDWLQSAPDTWFLWRTMCETSQTDMKSVQAINKVANKPTGPLSLSLAMI